MRKRGRFLHEQHFFQQVRRVNVVDFVVVVVVVVVVVAVVCVFCNNDDDDYKRGNVFTVAATAD